MGNRPILDIDLDRLIRRALPFGIVAVIVVAWDGTLLYPGWRSAWDTVAFVLHH
jgi:hypothetical protein